MTGGPDACWPWTGYITEDGYGRCWTNDYRGRRSHCIAYEKVNGPIPEGMQVCHTCDNPPCCNPKHLFLGTLQENMADRNAKGRQARGERMGRARFTEADILEMRGLAAEGLSFRAIARRFNCTSHTHIAAICRGEHWECVQGGESTRPKRAPKFSPKQIEAIRAAVKSGVQHKDLAAKHGVSRSFITMIANNTRY